MASENLCDECEGNTSNCHIYIMERLNNNQEITICEYCRHEYDWTGWIDDQELDELAHDSLLTV